MVHYSRAGASALPFVRFAAAIALVFPGGLTLQAQEAIPRLENGRPDLNGVWQVLNAANYDIEPHAARAALAFDPGPFGPVPASEVVALGAVGAVPAGGGVVEGGSIPYTPEALVRRDENRQNWLALDPEVRCYLPGIPRANYMPYPFQVFHSDQSVVFAYEYAGAVRNILLEDPGPAPVDSWMGQSVGRWNGDSFVIEVTGQNGRTWLDRAGNFYSAALRVTEQFTPTSAYTMRYQATLEDPSVFTRPWHMEMTLYRRVGEDSRLQQFNCIEFVEELIYGHLRKEPLR
jgi:hypothetical protein